MRISDWSSDVCSSDLLRVLSVGSDALMPLLHAAITSSGPETRNIGAAITGSRSRRLNSSIVTGIATSTGISRLRSRWHADERTDRKSVVSGKSVSVRVDLGGRSLIKNKTNKSI